jgi:hypothetical protein
MVIRKQTAADAGKDGGRERNPHVLLVTMEIGSATMEIRMYITHRKVPLPAIPSILLLDVHLKGIKISILGIVHLHTNVNCSTFHNC